jgi:collagenase-like PrtC family protease
VGAPPEIGNTGRFIGTYPTTMDTIAEMAALSHASGIELNVILNVPCLSEKEFDSAYLQKFTNFVKRLEEVSVDWITLAHPVLMKKAAGVRSTIKINTSTYNHIDHPLTAREFEKLGVDRLNLRQNTNRNLALIERIARYVSIPLELYVNSRCINGGFCPNAIAHANFKSHQQALEKDAANQARDPYLAGFCKPRRKRDATELLFTSTIRPEDVHLFESAGVNYFKLATRTVPVEETIRYVTAYGERRFDGNYGELFSMDGYADFPNSILDGLFERVKHLHEEDQLAEYHRFVEQTLLPVWRPDNTGGAMR